MSSILRTAVRPAKSCPSRRPKEVSYSVVFGCCVLDLSDCVSIGPGAVDYFEAVPLGSSAFYLIWKEPQEPNGVLLQYKIFYEKVTGTTLGPLIEREPPINDPKQTRAKLAGLEPDTKYRLHIVAVTIAGDGFE